MSECNHPHLTLLEGPMHPGGKDYHCDACWEQFRTSELNIGVHFGTAPSQSKEPKT